MLALWSLRVWTALCLILLEGHLSLQQDTTPPTLICPNTTVVGNGEVVRWAVPMATDNSGQVSLSSTHSIGEYFPLGDTTVTYTATDSSGLESNCSFTVTVIADRSPEISNCPNSTIVVTVPAGSTAGNATWIAPSAVDPEGGNVTTSSNFDPGTAFQLGTTKVMYTFIDDAGQMSRCAFKVKVVESSDAVPPQFVTSCPNDINVDTNPEVGDVSVSWTEPTFNDLVDGNDLHVTQTKESGSLFPEGATEVVYVAMDQNYNQAQCIFTVTVNVTDDDIAPTIFNCPNDTFLWVAMGTTSVNITWTPPTVTDNFGTPTLVATSDPGSTFDVGVTEVNYTATDHVGNVAYCSFVVTILVDDEAPVITGCPGNIVEYVDPSVTALPVTWAMPNVTDNSGEFNTSINILSGTSFQASVAGENDVVTMTYVDQFGNEAVCMFTVNVLVDMPPVFNCPAPIVVNNEAGVAYADVSWPQLNITDDHTPLASLVITMTHAEPLRVSYNSPTIVTYTATDERNNMAICTFTVTVNDVEPPVWQNCPSNITQPLDPGTNSAIVRWTNPTVTDNSGVDPTVTSSANNPELFFAGSYVVQYTARDEASNEGTCEFTVKIETDQDVPIFDNCPVGTLNFEADQGSPTTTVTWPMITATDNLAATVTVSSNYSPGQTLSIGTYSVEYQAVDDAGNIGYCGFTVVVVDLQQPQLTSCPSDQSFFVLNAIYDVGVVWNEPRVSDNSGTVTLVQTAGRSSGTRFIPGTYDVVYRAEDPTGNFVECSFTIDVMVKPETISLGGTIIFDIVRGLDGVFGGSARQDNLMNDLDDFFRGTSLGNDFVGLLITSSRFDANSNYVVGYVMYLCADSHYNEEGIKDIFNGALSGPNRDAFATSNVVVLESLDFNVVEFRGQFTLKSIESPGTVPVNFQSCCSDPTSNTYQDLQTRIYGHLQQTYGTMTPFRMSRILFLSPGSVIVDYTLTYDPNNAPAAASLEERFNDTVTPTTLELSEGVNTGLYLEVNGVKAGSTQAVCSSDYCFNGGTCMIANSSSYDVSCSCPYRYYGNRCQNQGLSWWAIIAISVGAGVLILLLLLTIACCSYLVIYSRQTVRDEEERRRRVRRKQKKLQRLYQQSLANAPLILKPAKPQKLYPKPMREKVVEPNDYAFTNGMFLHEIIDERQVNGPKFHGDKKMESQPRSPKLKRAHPADEPPKEKRKPKEKGPRFSHDVDPPKKKMKKLVPIPFPSRTSPSPPRIGKFPKSKPEVEKEKKKREKGPSFNPDGESKPMKSEKKKPRQKGPTFKHDTAPEEVGEMKERMFHEFSF